MWPFALALGLVVAGAFLLAANRRASRAPAPRQEPRRIAAAAAPQERVERRPAPSRPRAVPATPPPPKKAEEKPAASGREKPVAAKPAKAAAAPVPAEEPALPQPAGRKLKKVDRLVEAVKAEFEQLLKAKIERPGSTSDSSES